MSRVIVCALVCVLLALVACSGIGASPTTTVVTTATERPTAAPTREPSPPPTPDLTAYNDCQAAFGDLANALGQIDSRLAVGLSYSEFSDLLADSQVLYDRVVPDMTDLDLVCISDVGVPSEKALNAYFDALRRWKDCIDDATCTLDAIDAELQDLWSTAEGQIREARDGLAGLR